jgi:hypothetical protein
LASRIPNRKNAKSFALRPADGIKTWTAAHQWSKQKVEVQEDEHVEGRYYVKASLATLAKLATLISKIKKKNPEGSEE